MSENKDVYSEVKGQMRLSERIAAFVPGFRGYKEKEMRRESDRLVRNHLYRNYPLRRPLSEKSRRSWRIAATWTF